MYSNILTKEQTVQYERAVDILMDVPLSDLSFWRLSGFVEHARCTCATGLTLTLKGIQKYKLPKAKMINWLIKHGIASDVGFISEVLLPLAVKYDTDSESRFLQKREYLTR